MTIPASYAFLPWLRRGVSTDIGRRDDDPTASGRASLTVTLHVEAGGSKTVPVPVPLYGPGEVAGIDPRAIVRTFPPRDVHDAEPNLFAAIEFGQPDLPWRYTAARASTSERNRPWLVLIVLTEAEILALEQHGQEGELDQLVIKSGTSLPDLAQSWAWAHVQVSGVTEAETSDLGSLVGAEPHRALGRLLCPRRLLPRTRYGAFLVPAFERGRLAGLGESVPETLDALAPAWTLVGEGRIAAELRLPVYYWWPFETGLVGDFESLCRKLRARALPATVGRRKMDVGDPGISLPGASTEPMGLEGALLSLAAAREPQPWDAGQRTTFVNALTGLLNRPADLVESGSGVRAVAPPLYGRWHAAKSRLESTPPWYRELNIDPRTRVPAGLGTLVVQDQQEQLMASAWDQIDRVNELNQRLRQAQLAREATRSAFTRHIATLSVETTLHVTTPVLTKIKASPTTIREVLRESPIVPGVLDGQFRRLSRPFGSVGKKLRTSASNAGKSLLSRLNDGALQAAPVPPLSADMATPSRTGEGVVPEWASKERLGILQRWLLGLLITAVILLALALMTGLLMPGQLAIAALFAVAGFAALVAWGFAAREIAQLAPAFALRDGRLDAAMIETHAAPSSFVPILIDPIATPSGIATPLPLSVPPIDDAERERAVTAFRSAASQLFTMLRHEPLPSTRLVRADLPRLVRTARAAIDPAVAVVAPYAKRIELLGGFAWQPEDPLEPIMAAPEFEQPMYEPLRDLSQDWLLPGVKDIPQNVTSLLVTNQRFVEAYMVGLNHEMGRELLWREYPTDQRGSYFRQFWDVRGFVWPEGTTPDPNVLHDIKPIHGWRGRDLGQNSPRRPPPGGNYLVFLVRGEVVARYPNLIVYAVKATSGSGGRAIDESQPMVHPVFEGRLKPDIAFFGFELTEVQAKGDPNPARDQGYFFVLQEQPSEPKFGLDVADVFGGVVTNVNDLSWSRLAADRAGLDAITYIDLNSSLPQLSLTPAPGVPTVRWQANAGSRASDIAYLTLQRPFRVALHGSDMIPEED